MGTRSVIRHQDWTLGLIAGPDAPPKMYALNCATCQETSEAGPDREAVERWAFAHADKYPAHQRYPLACTVPFLVSPAPGNLYYVGSPPRTTDGLTGLVPTPRAVDRRAWWTLTADFTADAPAPLYGLECVRCGDAPERSEEREPLELWALRHTGRTVTHREYVAVTVAPYRALPLGGNPSFEAGR